MLGCRHTTGVPRALTAGFAVAILSLTACRDDESPTSPSPAAPQPNLASTTAALTFRVVSAGSGHSCGVTVDDLAYCWGRNEAGQLGVGNATGPSTCGPNNLPCSNKPVAVIGGLHFRSISAGGQHTCAVTTDDRAYCWGLNDTGELGTGSSSEFEARPVAVAGDRHWHLVTAGEFHSCGMTNANVPLCWGYNGWGQLGDGTEMTRFKPVRVKPTSLAFRTIVAGGVHTCGLTTDNRAWCWGNNDWGQLGDKSKTSRVSPILVVNDHRYENLRASRFNTCGTTPGHDAYCWGRNSSGETGDGSITPRRLQPVLVTGKLAFRRVTPGWGHTCGETTSDRAYCWGQGALGTGSTDLQASPAPVAGNHVFSQLAAGEDQSCGNTPEGVAYCWGDNTWGQLGDGSNTSRLVPVAVAGP